MPLYHSLSARNTHSIRLAKMGSIPSTEDLKYALAEAKKHQKQIDLPFKNPDNNLNFAITVVPGTGINPPKWEFYREDADGSACRLWSRESNEVIMIQGKIKIESCYSNAMAQSTSQDDIPAISSSTVIANPSATRPAPPSDSWASNSGSFPAYSNEQSESGSFKSLSSSSSNLRAGERSLGTSGSWEAPLPAPAAIDDQAVNEILASLTDNNTGLLKPAAFLLYLLGWCTHSYNKGLNAALIVFDIQLSRENQTLSLAGNEEKAFYDWAKTGLRHTVKAYDPITCLEKDEFAALLYGADKASAQKFAGELKENLAATPLPEVFSDCQLVFAAGIFPIATSTREPGRALSAARQAKGMARTNRFPYFVFPS